MLNLQKQISFKSELSAVRNLAAKQQIKLGSEKSFLFQKNQLRTKRSQDSSKSRIGLHHVEYSRRQIDRINVLAILQKLVFLF
jgi:hypothetical protein